MSSRTKATNRGPRFGFVALVCLVLVVLGAIGAVVWSSIETASALGPLDRN